MNLKGRLEHIAIALDAGRQFGKTHVIAKICQEADGVLLAHNFDFARDLERKYNITSKSIDVNLHGLGGPFFLDHSAASRLLFRAAAKIQDLEEKNRKLQNKLHKINAVVNENID